MKPEFFLIDAATGKPAAAYRTTIATPGFDNVKVHDMDQAAALQWLDRLIDKRFVIEGSNAQCVRLGHRMTGNEAEIWGVGAIHFPKPIWETRAEAEDAGG